MAEPDRTHLALPRRTRLAMAVEARVDIRTIEAALRGDPIKGDAGERAREVLRAHGHLPAESAA